MTAIGIRYLTGYAAATDLAADAAEWPPHPGRIFMALAAAYFETQGGAEERAALLWLESLPAPSIYASEAQPRSKVESYVPVNDDAGNIHSRSKQLRTFRKTRPDSDTVVLRWNVDPPESIAAPLRTLCEKVTRIGYSASLTQVWVACAEAPELPASNWIPDEGLDSTRRMRIPSGGTLATLEHSYNKTALDEYEAFHEALASAAKSAQAKIRKKTKERFPLGPPQPERPSMSVWQGYRQILDDSDAAPLQGPFDPGFLVLAPPRERDVCILGLESTQQLTGALRNAAMKAAGENPPEWLTGHAPNGRPSTRPHAAFFPLPFVGRKYADGHVMGLGIALPRWLLQTAAGRNELRERLGPLLFQKDGSDCKVKLWSEARKWEWELEREVSENIPQSLQRKNWTGPSFEWASATPVVLHHHPKKREGHAEQILADALVTAQYPEVEWIRLSPVSAFEGAGAAHNMPPYTLGGENLCRYHVHAVIRFRQKVEGPVLVGRGRYRGYGLFKPHREKAEEQR